MEHERKWFSLKNITLTVGLLVILAIVLFIEVCLFISGPALRYEDKIAEQEASITSQYPDLQNLERHVFAYVMYSGHNDTMYYWFNEKGELIEERDMSELDIDQATQKVNELYALNDISVAVGYGYENPVYLIQNDEVEVYLDIDSLETIFYRKKGEKV